jgi:hypothetical protein
VKRNVSVGAYMNGLCLHNCRENVEKMRCFEREGVMGIVALFRAQSTA